MITISAPQESNVVTLSVSGKLTKDDYEILVPELEKRIEKFGTIRLLIEINDFNGWEAGALWEDTKFAARHFSDIARIAVVGDKRWEKTLTTFIKPFTRADVRHYPTDEIAQAKQWVTS